jgi:hypothetical protein
MKVGALLVSVFAVLLVLVGQVISVISRVRWLDRELVAPLKPWAEQLGALHLKQVVPLALSE